jgi:hypothetical protein
MKEKKCKFCGEYHLPKKEDYKKIMEILDAEMKRREEMNNDK